MAVDLDKLIDRFLTWLEPARKWLESFWIDFSGMKSVDQVTFLGGGAIPFITACLAALGFVWLFIKFFFRRPKEVSKPPPQANQLILTPESKVVAGFLSLPQQERERIFTAIEAIKNAPPPKGQTTEAVHLAVDEALVGELTDILAIAEKSYSDAAVAEGTATRTAELAAKAKAAAGRNLGSLLLPSNKARAYALFREATELDSSDFWGWIERGRLAQTCGDTSDMIASNRKALEIAKSRDDNREIAIAESAIADHLLVTSGSSKAVEHYQRANIALLNRANADLTSVEKQRDLSVSYDRIGDVKQAQGDGVGALKAFEAGLAIGEKLAAQDPSNAGWQRDLSVSYNKIGDVKQAQGDGVGALKAFEAGLAIREKLAAQDPSNAGWQRDLIVSYVKISEVGVNPKMHLEKALAVALDMEAKGIFAPVDGWIVEDLRKRLKAVRGKKS